MPKGTLSVASSVDMLAEPLLPKLLLFSFPLMMSSVLQLLFNAADVIVVGRCASYMSLAAVGSTTVIVNLVVNLLVGLAVGVNVVIAHYLGEGGRDAEISAVLHTAIALALAGGIVLGGIGYVLSGWMLRITNVQEDIFPLALSYLQIYFIGTPSIVLYNYGAAALRAKGDTRLPLVFLTISGVVNVVLNLLIVIVLQLDVVGVALATVISETLSAVLILTNFIRAKDGLAFSWNKIRIDRRSLILLAKIGIPAGAQGCMFSLANMSIQSAINAYGGIVVAGSSAASSIEGFIYVSMNAFHHAAQTFCSQNIGAGQYGRVRRILRKCTLCAIVTGVVLCSCALAMDTQLLKIYNQDPNVVADGIERLYIVAVLYAVFGIADVLTGAIRACGSPVLPVVINLLCTCVFRLLWIAAIDIHTVSVRWVYASFPASWVLLMVVLAVCWRSLYKKQILPHIEGERDRG